MLYSLYDYAIRNHLTLPLGYVKKTLKAYILLNHDGTFHDVEVWDNEVVEAPDIGSFANGTDKSNVLLEKRSVVIPEKNTKKSKFFLHALEDGGQYEPMLQTCAKALNDHRTVEQIRKRLDEKKIKLADRVSFKVDMHSILDSEKTKNWWGMFRQSVKGDSGGGKSLCLITGNVAEPMMTTTPISGLKPVGGHARGDALICFDKPAFCSYDLKKAMNAPISEEAFAAVKAAFDDLLSHDKSPILAGMKFVHWYDQTISQKDDPFFQCGDFFDLEPLEDEEGFESKENGLLEEMSEKEIERERKATERSAVKVATKFIHSLTDGETAPIPDNLQYHILLLSGVNGRVMIRHYERGRYDDLENKLAKWHEDLNLINPSGKVTVSSCKLTARLMRLMKRQNNDNKPFDRMAKELAGITPMVLSAILSGGMLPDSVAVRALSNIRSYNLDDDADERDKKTICYAYQWLKIWLIRNRGKGEIILKEYNPGYEGVAYHCGAMMAVYEKIQKTVMRDVKVTVVQRYYASAMQTPALVMGILSKMSVHHLEKFENKYFAEEMKKHLREVSTSIKGPIPTTLNLEQQSEFALGYYQMGAEMNRLKREKGNKSITVGEDTDANN